MVGIRFTLLGCPIPPTPPPDFCEEVFWAGLLKLKDALGALHDMGNAQLETTLLRSCLVVSFVLRACPPIHLSHSSAEGEKEGHDKW